MILCGVSTPHGIIAWGMGIVAWGKGIIARGIEGTR